MAKYSLEFKMKVVVEYLSGNIGLEILAKKHKIKSAEQVKRWIKAYQNLGIQGLKRSRNNRSYSVDFKLKAITMYETSEKSYQDVANELGLNNPTFIFSWRKAYHEQGIDGLSRKRGRATLSKKDPANKAKVPSSKPPNEITDLELANQRIKELEYELRLQTIKLKYLEMLRSLRLEEATKAKQGSSTSSENKKDIH